MWVTLLRVTSWKFVGAAGKSYSSVEGSSRLFRFVFQFLPVLGLSFCRRLQNLYLYISCIIFRIKIIYDPLQYALIAVYNADIFSIFWGRYGKFKHYLDNSNFTVTFSQFMTQSTIMLHVSLLRYQDQARHHCGCQAALWLVCYKHICEVREKTNKMQQSDIYYQHFLNMFRATLCPSSGDQDVCYCMWYAALVLLDVVGLHSAHTPQGSAPQPLPTTSSRTSAAHHMQ